MCGNSLRQRDSIGATCSMRIDVLTLFPEMFPGYMGQSVLKRAIDAGLVDIQLHDIRDWARGKHQQVDDRPSTLR